MVQKTKKSETHNPEDKPQPTPSLLRINKVSELIGLSRASIYKLISEGKFPKPKQLSVRAVAWDTHDLSVWIKALPVAGKIETNNK